MRCKEKRQREERKREEGREEEGRVKETEWGRGREEETYRKRKNRCL